MTPQEALSEILRIVKSRLPDSAKVGQITVILDEIVW